MPLLQGVLVQERGAESSSKTINYCPNTMNPATFLVVFTLASSITALLTIRPSRSVQYLIVVVSVLLINVAAISIAAIQDRSQNLVVQILSGNLLQDRVGLATHVAAACLGVIAGISFGTPPKSRTRLAALLMLYAGAAIGLSALAARDLISPYLSEPTAAGGAGLVKREAATGWAVRKIVDLNLSPAAIGWRDDQTLLVAGYAGGYLQHGSVVQVNLGEDEPSIQSIATGMTRPHGVVFHDGDIYISRAGQYARAVNGQLIQEATGAITRLRDLNGDGTFDHFEDVVSDLPGAQLPDGLHQNNAIAFMPDGKLMITVGTPTDHAPPIGAYDGTILRCEPDGSNLEVFARGFRNPFGLTVGPQGKLFCSDNDPNVDDFGDKINLVIEDGHYGHPYDALPGLDVGSVIPPILRLPSAQGLAYMPAGVGSPIDDRLLVAGFGDNSVNTISLDFGTDPPRGRVEFLANVPTVVALCVTPGGRIFACSYGERAIYEILRVDET